jgi:tetratricopeptide (TPR) repeat protein
MRKYILLFLGISLLAMCLLAVFLFSLPALQEGLGWRLQSWRARIKYALAPPEKLIFTPGAQGATIPSPTWTPTQIPSPTPTIDLATAVPASTPTPTLPPTLTPTPLPPSASLGGFLHMYQMWNNCGPANLAMALTYWGWKGDQRAPAAFMKPNQRDKNVMPYEMEAYVEQETDFEAVVRVGGDLETLKAFIASDFPVLAEKGFEGTGFDGWMGHYQVVNGYDDAAAAFYVQDSYKGPNIQIPYDDFLAHWRAFNYTYLVIYPPDRNQQVLDILGLQAYDNFNFHHADSKAEMEAATLSGRDQYFAWFNRGSSLVALQDYTAAALAYDTAFANYPSIPEESRPWRMMWYQTGPYFAYYYTGRYQDVIDLATTTLDAMSEPILEESYYWRARAKLSLGQVESATEDLRTCLEVHPDFAPCVEELVKLGLEP